MTQRTRSRLLVVIAGIAFVLLFAAATTGNAAPATASWSLYNRANATSFVAGAGLQPPASGGGWEIVSFDAQPVATGLATYLYGGADLPPARGGPLSLISCAAVATPLSLSVTVANGYPYGGCVFFVGVTNTGAAPLQVRLGGLDGGEAVSCSAPGCRSSDIELVAGGPDAAAIAALCRTEGGTLEPVSGLVYGIPAGATLVCPLFVTVLQAARENATYVVAIAPHAPAPEPTPSPSPTPSSATATATATSVSTAPNNCIGCGPTLPPRTSTSGAGLATRTPAAAPSTTPTPPPSTATAAATAVGRATAAVTVVPKPPVTGTGLLSNQSAGRGARPLLLLFVVLGAFGTAFAVIWAGDRRR
ncbi:MAG: hypothetical protein HYX53_04235 [Chloroflexi bacterium]|nr:hypothetical protein [Chloroflexota bacterium]